MSFGVADYAASTRARTTVIGGVNRDSGVLTDKDADGKRAYYWTDPWHAAQTRMLVACRAYGLAPDRRPLRRFRRPGWFCAPPRSARPCSGYEGKWAIHPSQIELGNEVFTPSRSRSDQGAAASSRRWRTRHRKGAGPCRSTARLIDYRQHPHG